MRVVVSVMLAPDLGLFQEHKVRICSRNLSPVLQGVVSIVFRGYHTLALFSCRCSCLEQ